MAGVGLGMGRTEGEGEEEEDGGRMLEDASPTTRALLEHRQLHSEMSEY